MSSSTTRKAASSSALVPSSASTSAKTRSAGTTRAVRTASSSDLADPSHRAPTWVRLLNEVDLSNRAMLAERKPEWLRVRPPSGENYAHLKSLFRSLDLHTVCEEAHCPNVWECWGGGTATIMLMGDTCTRGCRFCAVTSGNPHGVLDLDEPKKVAMALAEMDLTYVVLTSVDRDDLEDGGAGHFAKTVREIKARRPEVLAAMRSLRANAVDIITVGQYLRPSNWHLAVQEYVPPEEFEALRVAGESMGFAYVAAGPLVRSSYRAGEFFLEKVLRERKRVPAGRGHGRRRASPDHRRRRHLRFEARAAGRAGPPEARVPTPRPRPHAGQPDALPPAAGADRILRSKHRRGGGPGRQRDGPREAGLGLPGVSGAGGRPVARLLRRDADRSGVWKRQGSATGPADAEPLRGPRYQLRAGLQPGRHADPAGRRRGMGREDPQGGHRRAHVLRRRRHERGRLPRRDELLGRLQDPDDLLLQEQPVGHLRPGLPPDRLEDPCPEGFGVRLRRRPRRRERSARGLRGHESGRGQGAERRGPPAGRGGG